MENKTAIFIDAENITAFEAYPLIFKNLISKGYIPCIRKMVISQITDEFKDLTSIVKQNYFDLVLSYKPIESKKEKNKNNADFRLYIEVCKVLFSKEYQDINTFVIGSSDEGFTELIILLKKMGKKVLGIGNRGKGRPLTSTQFKQLFDEFYFVEDILEAEKKKQEEALLEAKKKAEQKANKKEKKRAKKTKTVINNTPKVNNNEPKKEVIIDIKPIEKNEEYYKTLKNALLESAKQKTRFEFSELKNYVMKRYNLPLTKGDLETLNIVITQDNGKDFVKLTIENPEPNQN